MSGVAAAKKLFFTAAVVWRELDAGTRRALSKFGAYVRQRAKSSLKYKDGAAAPGSPPHVHRSQGFTRPGGKKGKARKPKKAKPTSPLRELTYFSYDPADKSVVVGPALGGPKTGAPKTVEEGGAVRVDGRTVTVRPRPWLGPAFRVELKKVGGDFRDILKR